MGELIDLINAAEERKPKFGDDCNGCGWCCLTEVCETGKMRGGGEMLPCKFLTISRKCGLVVTGTAKESDIGANTSCCAITQKEAIGASA